MSLRWKSFLGLGFLAAPIAVIYGPILMELGRDWIRDPNYSHGFLIPAISGFLLWQRREQLSRADRSPSFWGLIGVVLSLLLLLFGTAGAEVFTQRVSLIFLLGSMLVFLEGWGRARIAAFPLVFLLLAIPMPYILYYSLTGPMQGFAAQCAITGLKLVGVPAVAQGNIIHLPDTSLEVAEACSGIRSLYAFLALGALLAQSMKIPVWARMAVFLATIPLSVAGNAIRVWGSGLGAHTIGPEAAEGTIHELFGMVVFAGAVISFLLLRMGIRVIWRSESES